MNKYSSFMSRDRRQKESIEERQNMQAPEGTYTFYKDDRDRVKGRSMLPTETLRYIEALEQVALAAYAVWVNTPHASKPHALTRECLNELYDKLSTVNFMDDTL